MFRAVFKGGGAKALPCVILAPLHLKFVAPPEPHMILLSFRAPSFFLIPQIPPPPLGKISVYSPDVYSTKTTVTIIPMDTDCYYYLITIQH